jgi:hypothetical protein
LAAWPRGCITHERVATFLIWEGMPTGIATLVLVRCLDSGRDLFKLMLLLLQIHGGLP